MKYLTNLKNNYFPTQPIVFLGRWNIVYCNEKINKKIDLSNEDHCGACNINSLYQYKKYKDINQLIFYETM